VRDAADLDPWEGLRWKTVHVLLYRQHKANGEVVEAYCLSDFSMRKGSSRTF